MERISELYEYKQIMTPTSKAANSTPSSSNYIDSAPYTGIDIVVNTNYMGMGNGGDIPYELYAADDENGVGAVKIGEGKIVKDGYKAYYFVFSINIIPERKRYIGFSIGDTTNVAAIVFSAVAICRPRLYPCTTINLKV